MLVLPVAGERRRRGRPDPSAWPAGARPGRPDPDDPAGLGHALALGRLHRHPAHQLGAEGALLLGRGAADAGDLGGDLWPQLGPGVAAPRGREGAQLERAVLGRPGPRRRPRRSPRRPRAAPPCPSSGATTRLPRSMPPCFSTCSSRSTCDSSKRSHPGQVQDPRPPRRARSARRSRPCARTSRPGAPRRRGHLRQLARRTRRWSRSRPSPRADSGSSAASTKAAVSQRCTTSWAIRSPRWTVNGSVRSVLTRQHLHLAAVAGVDGAGSVDDRDPVPRGEARARVHQADVPLGQGHRDARSAPAPAPPAAGSPRRPRGGRRRRRRGGRTTGAAARDRVA